MSQSGPVAMGRTIRKSRREKEQEDMQKLLVDLEANTTYHSFPRPTFSERRSSPAAMMGPTKAEKSLRDVLRAYPARPFEPEEAAEEPSPPFTRLHYAFIPPAADVTTATSVGISSAAVRNSLLCPTHTTGDSSFWFTSHPNTPVTIVRTPTPRPQSALSIRAQPRKVYSSPLDALASTRLHIIQQEEELRPYEMREERRVLRVLEMVVGAVLFIGMLAGVGGIFTIGIGESDIGGLGVGVKMWRRVFGMGGGTGNA
ncbi:hypothetical protein EV426DRAFT_676157 [Tirmania nivea]|nr:hypothetical protein EV426DRAFT_676157 [Tirmania nivea]